MRDTLAETLLAKILGWQPPDVARERPVLQAMASLKYDEYEQFSPGLRFIESLALWLNQFHEPSEREIAYQFIKKSLVFCSAEEMDHLVETAYHDYIRPILLGKSASEQNLNRRHVGRIASSVPFRMLQRQTLFLGLSDGARIDTFRRANGSDLYHEQIWQTHELPMDRGDELLKELSSDLTKINGAAVASPKFRTIVLLDDFSASGSSYYSIKNDGTTSGKIAKFLRNLTLENTAVHGLCDSNGIDIIILIYMATEQAIEHLSEAFRKAVPGVTRCDVRTVQFVPAKIKLNRGGHEEFNNLIEKYYDPETFDFHMQKGKTKDGKYGYADCGLPVVLHHNTPNNSVAILWSYEHCKFRGLFPRIQRHRVMS